MWPSYAFKAAFALGALVHSFSGSFAGRSLEVSWRRCHSSSGFSLSQFVLFLHVIPDRLVGDQISVWSTGCSQTPCANKNLTRLLKLMTKWMFTNVKLIFPSEILQQKIEITDLKPFLTGENTSVLIILATTVFWKAIKSRTYLNTQWVEENRSSRNYIYGDLENQICIILIYIRHRLCVGPVMCMNNTQMLCDFQLPKHAIISE